MKFSGYKSNESENLRQKYETLGPWMDDDMKSRAPPPIFKW